jgi:outer membrane protein assembly factor BamB
VSDGLVLIHTSNGQLQALNEADGLVKWTVNLDMPSLSLRGESAPAPLLARRLLAATTVVSVRY